MYCITFLTLLLPLLSETDNSMFNYSIRDYEVQCKYIEEEDDTVGCLLERSSRCQRANREEFASSRSSINSTLSKELKRPRHLQTNFQPTERRRGWGKPAPSEISSNGNEQKRKENNKPAGDWRNRVPSETSKRTHDSRGDYDSSGFAKRRKSCVEENVGQAEVLKLKLQRVKESLEKGKATSNKKPKPTGKSKILQIRRPFGK